MNQGLFMAVRYTDDRNTDMIDNRRTGGLERMEKQVHVHMLACAHMYRYTHVHIIYICAF